MPGPVKPSAAAPHHAEAYLAMTFGLWGRGMPGVEPGAARPQLSGIARNPMHARTRQDHSTSAPQNADRIYCRTFLHRTPTRPPQRDQKDLASYSARHPVCTGLTVRIGISDDAIFSGLAAYNRD